MNYQLRRFRTLTRAGVLVEPTDQLADPIGYRALLPLSLGSRFS